MFFTSIAEFDESIRRQAFGLRINKMISRVYCDLGKTLYRPTPNFAVITKGKAEPYKFPTIAGLSEWSR